MSPFLHIIGTNPKSKIIEGSILSDFNSLGQFMPICIIIIGFAGGKHFEWRGRESTAVDFLSFLFDFVYF